MRGHYGFVTEFDSVCPRAQTLMGRSLKSRLAWLVGAFALLQAGGVLLLAYTAVEHELDVQKRRLLEDRAHQAHMLIEELRDAAAVRDNAYRLVEIMRGRAELHVAVAAASRTEKYVASSPIASASIDRLWGQTWQTDGFLEWSAAPQDTPVLSIAAAGRTRDQQAYDIVVSIERSDDSQLLDEIRLAAAASAPIALAAIFLGALLILSIGLRPLSRFQQAVDAVTVRSLSARLDTRLLPAELARLGTAFNQMLDRLDDEVTRLWQFGGDLAHELKTPLATVMGRSQVALSRERSVEELARVLEENIEEARRLAGIVSDMLFLARAEDSGSAVRPAPLRLQELARKVADYLELVAAERDLTIEVQGEATVQADAGLMERALLNLLSNAVRHAATGSSIVVRIGHTPGPTRIEVVNTGKPIPPEYMAHLFERFYRVPDPTSQGRGGTGLGLAIVKAIMDLHCGSVGVTSEPTGEVRFWLEFPG